MAGTLHFGVEHIALSERGLGMTATVPYRVDVLADAEDRHTVAGGLHPQPSTGGQIVEREDTNPAARHTRPSCCAATNLALTSSRNGAASAGWGSLRMTSSKKPRTSMRAARSRGKPRLIK